MVVMSLPKVGLGFLGAACPNQSLFASSGRLLDDLSWPSHCPVCRGDIYYDLSRHAVPHQPAIDQTLGVYRSESPTASSHCQDSLGARSPGHSYRISQRHPNNLPYRCGHGPVWEAHIRSGRVEVERCL